MKLTNVQKLLMCVLLLGMPVVSAKAQSDPDELITTAQRAFDDGFHDVAIKYLEEFIPAYPQNPKINQAKLLLGQCYYFKNDFDKAIALFEQVPEGKDNKDLLLFWKAETHLKLSKYAMAQQEYQQLLKDFSSSVYVPQAMYSLAWTSFDQKDYAKAKDLFSQLLTKFPKHQLTEDAVLKVAECDYNTGDFTNAIKGLEDYIRLYPQSTKLVQIRLNLADANYYINDYTHAMEYYEQVLKLTQDASMMQSAYEGRIWCAIRRKMYEQATKFIKEALDFTKSKNFNNSNILLAQGQMFFEKSEMDNAVNAYSEIIRNNLSVDYKLEAYLGRGNAFYESKKYSKAQEDFQYVIDHHQVDDVELSQKANFGLGWVLVKQGNVTAGVRCFESVYQQATNEEVKNNALIQMADAYNEGGRYPDAVNIYQQILKSGNNGMEDYIQYRLSVALLKAEKYDNAQTAFDALVSKFPQSRYVEDVNYYLGVIAFKNNNLTKAVQYMEGFLKGLTHPSDFAPQANYILGLSYLNLKQTDEALKIFQKILRLYPDDEVVAKNSDIGIAKCFSELGQSKEAVKRFKLIVFKYPKTDVEQESLLWLAQDAMKNFQYPQAIGYYQELLSRNLDEARQDQINYELGQAFEVQGALDDALEKYKQVSAKDEALSSKVKLAMAGILSKEFDPQKAINAYASIAATSADYARDAYLKIAQLYRNAQNYEQEITVYEKALKVDQGKSVVSNVELLFSLADAYESLSRIDEAIEFYLKIPAQYGKEVTWVVKAYLRVAKIFEDRKDWEEARVTYQKIVQLKVDESKFALERLDLLKKK